MSIYVYDAGAWQEVIGVWAYDGGWQPATVFVHDGGWNQVWPTTCSFEITAGSAAPPFYTGYYSGVCGALDSITDLPAGLTLVQAWQEDNSGTLTTWLGISGFASNPGQNYVENFTLNGINKGAGSAAIAYAYSGGVATWQWAGYSDLINGDMASGTITFG